MLARDGVHAFPVSAFGGFDLQRHFLAKGSGKETAHGVSLPACGFHQFGQGRAFGRFQEGDNMGALAALAPRSSLGPAFPPLFAPAGFRADLACVVTARGFWAAARCRRSGCRLILLLGSHESDCSFGGSYRVMTLIALI